jgi:cell division protein YceG involved in septum cleavage
MQPNSYAKEAMVGQRTGRFALTLTFIPDNVSLEQILRDLADGMTRMIEKATDDGRNYDIQVRITADITVDASQAKVDEYITELPLDVPRNINTVETDGVLFKRTALGWERIE